MGEMFYLNGLQLDWGLSGYDLSARYCWCI